MARLQLEMTRDETIAALMERDGDRCMFPGCTKPWDNGNHMITFDHVFPQHLARQAGWTRAQTDDISNLQLMGKQCNSLKGHQLPDENGMFRVVIREPKVTKGPRPDLCELCYSGRLLFPGEVCPDCNGTAQPATMPKVLQRTPKECDHARYICWACGPLGIIERKAAFRVMIDGPE